MDYIIILCTINSIENAETIANNLLQDHFAACINIIPQIQSYYFWNGKIQNDEEFLLLIKTGKNLFNSVKERIEKLHPYEIPEIISIDITTGNQKYLTWIKDNTINFMQ